MKKNEGTDDWFVFEPNEDFGPSEIDLSDWLDAPAGKHGFLKNSGADLAFEDGTPVKFWGVNISSARAFSEQSKVDQWVKHLAKYGVNAVRFHKFTRHAYKGDYSTVLEEDKLRKFDYFVSELAAKGIYYGWSHIYGHKVKPADSSRLINYEEIKRLSYPWSHLNGSTSALINFAPDLQDLSIDLTVNMLNRVNERTGKRYAEDPALAFIEMQNEDNIFWSAIGKALEQAPTYHKMLCQQFSDWLEAKYETDEQLSVAWGSALTKSQSLQEKTICPMPDHGSFSAEYVTAYEEGREMRTDILDRMNFLHETQLAFFQRFESAIRGTGYQGVLVGSCWQAGSGPSHFYNLHADYQVGMIDRHNYWGGGTGHHMVPGGVKTKAMVSRPGSGLLSTGMQQVANRPFSLSEWMSLIPNEWVAEGVPIVAFYGMGLQGWDASFHFGSDFPGFTKTIHTPGVYNVSSPTQLTLYPAISRMIYRGDIQESEVLATRHVHIPSLADGRLGFLEKVEQGYDDKYITGDVPSEALAIGRLAVAFSDNFQVTSVPDLSDFWDQETKTIKSSTEELYWDYSNGGYFTVHTDATVGVVGFVPERAIDFGDMSMEIKTPFAVVLLTALGKGETIGYGNSLLLTTVARARNTGMTYSASGDELLDPGRAPILMEPVRLTLTWPGGQNGIVHVLDHVGQRTGRTMPLKNGSIELDGAETKSFYYELVFP